MEQGPPKQQVMDPNLEALPGVVVKEKTQMIDAVMQSVGGSYEHPNTYYVKAMPNGKLLANNFDDQAGTWIPSLEEIDELPEVFVVKEKSDCCHRVLMAGCGLLNLRALTLHFYANNTERFFVERPCKCGGRCGKPLEMTLHHKEQGMMGMVVEDFDSYCHSCFEQWCLFTYRHKVLVGNTRDSLVHKYSLVNSARCCGRVNNCCGATCCKPLFFIDIVEPDGSLVVAGQKVFPGGDFCANFCRSNYHFDNYILPFPPKSTQAERMLLLTGLLSIEYAYHSRKGGKKRRNQQR